MGDLQCPKCDSKEIGEGKQSGYAYMFPVGKAFSAGSEIHYHICTDCGYILEGYVKKPEKFK